MPASLLGRIARYGVSPLRNAREDRLTEICAALFDSPYCDGLARHVALGWLANAAEQTAFHDPDPLRRIHAALANPDLAWKCSVKTQLRIEDEDVARRPDLELRFVGSASDGCSEHATLWIEVKHGTRPHTNQLHSYVSGQSDRGLVNAAVLLVAPRTQIPTFARDEIPDEVPCLTWEETADLFRSYQVKNAIGSFLVRELCTYLREEGLMDPDQLTPLHLVALANHREAVIALERVCHLADEEVSRRWNAQENHDWYPRHSPLTSWWNYATHPRKSRPPAQAGAWYFEWMLFRNAGEFSDGRPGVPCFATGMTAEASARSLSKLDQQTQARFEREGFEIIPTSKPSGYEHVWRRAYPEEVLAGRDLVKQGAALGSWIVDSFAALTNALDESP